MLLLHCREQHKSIQPLFTFHLEYKGLSSKCFKYGPNQFSLIIFQIPLFLYKATVRGQNNQVKPEIRKISFIKTVDIQDNVII
jgi:hypothetical protein